MEQQISDYLAATENTMPLYKAPDISEQIWHQHQNRKLTKFSAIAASVCILSLTFWLSGTPEFNQAPSLITQNQQLEHQLAQLSTRQLPANQQIIIDNWQYELEMLDQSLEYERDRILSQDLWSFRNQLLTQMINFYQKPIDLYEI